MAWYPQGIWRYAVLILLLLVLAAVAAMSTLASIEKVLLFQARVASPEALHEYLGIITLTILALTMGFLFLAGSMGIWAIRSTARVESRHRVGRFVDAMEYLSDGLVAVDHRGRITGSNPSARHLAGREPPPRSRLRDLFQGLTEAQEARLLYRGAPQEVDLIRRDGDELRALRFRSQPSEDMQLVLISDVTQRTSEEIRARHVATLQVIGRIARGVAHDFNNILCAISGHTELVRRGPLTEMQVASLQAIARESNRGASLAAQVLRLSRTDAQGEPCNRLGEQISKTVELLKVGLSSPWRVEVDVQGAFHPTLLTCEQIEQLILSLALLAADESGAPGTLLIRARPAPSREPLFDVGLAYSAAVWIGVAPSSEETAAVTRGTPLEAGVIVSVVRSLIGEAGGRLDILAHEGQRGYRLCLPVVSAGAAGLIAHGILSEEQIRQIASWRVLLAASSSAATENFVRLLEGLRIEVRRAGDLVTALQAVEGRSEFNALVMDKELLGEDAAALLRAIRKLRPHVGIVLLAASEFSTDPSLRIELIREADPPDPILLRALWRSVERLRIRPEV